MSQWVKFVFYLNVVSCEISYIVTWYMESERVRTMSIGDVGTMYLT